VAVGSGVDVEVTVGGTGVWLGSDVGVNPAVDVLVACKSAACVSAGCFEQAEIPIKLIARNRIASRCGLRGCMGFPSGRYDQELYIELGQIAPN
jgi:hypothetical protein